MKTSLILLFACISAVAATNSFNLTDIPCESGGCCNLLFKRVLTAGSPCVFSSHPCFESHAVCDGVHAKCQRVFKADGTQCGLHGQCKNGLCIQDGKVYGTPAKSYLEVAMRSKNLTMPGEEPKEEPKEEPIELDENPVIVHETEDPILETLRHLPELAKMRQKKHEIEENKVKAFRKLTHLVIRKQTEQLEKNQLFYRHGQVRLQDEMQDDMNLHRHLHLHHNQNHGLDANNNSTIENLENSLLKASQSSSSGTSQITIFCIVGLCVVAVILVIVIIVYTTKAATTKTKRKDYY